ncbi:MAG: 3-isopropylmalate dehydratase [Planctomycetes bacterium]|nr:3-isopropylmalate dehydratase [Planctomycetota bacterium]MBI3847319.1 3-isopropylmalate dehydratase [Planctomycetota bacterium]
MPTLLRRPVQKRPSKVKIQGRILFLTEDPELVRSQLAGQDLDWKPSMKLRDQISTDEITPAWVCYYFDETLGEYPYVGFKAGNEFPIGRNAVKTGRFAVSVSGQRRGKGSSREASPYAEMCAGIRLVIAENIERIYKQNCQNLGVLTSTDFGLIDRIRRGEEIPLSEFTRGEDAITAAVIEHGGLFNYNVARLQGKVEVPRVTTGKRPMTLAEKILAAHFIADAAKGQVGVPYVKPGDAGFVRTDVRFSHEYVTPMASIFFETLVGPDEKVVDPDSIYFFRDHLTFLPLALTEERKREGLLEVAKQLEVKQREFAVKQGVRLHGELPTGGSEAICHSKIAESYALPGQVIIGSDSHTPHSGALGCVAFGVGTTDIFNSWITKDVRVRVPQSVKFLFKGKPAAGITAKDLMLEILRTPYVKSGKAIGQIAEYAGAAVEALNVDERATMTNMAAEVGAFTGIIAPDARVADFLVANRGMKRAEADRLCNAIKADPDAEYAEIIEIDATKTRPLVALPGDPGNGVSIDDLPKTKIEIAYGGSCTAGKREDMDMYAKVLKHAIDHGRHVAPGVTFWIQYGSQEVKHYCEAKGYVKIFEDAGAKVIEPSCGACINAGPGVSTRKDQVTVSAINRNFPGRSGPGQMYLASPLTVAASALEGYITEWKP